MGPRAKAENLDDYKPTGENWKPSGKFSHDDTHVRVDADGKEWFVKGVGVTMPEARPPSDSTHSSDMIIIMDEDTAFKTAVAEVVGQEILRKFLPDTQPKYQLATDNGSPPNVYVMSEKIDGFTKPQPENLKNKTFGKLSALCLFLGETDFKIGNLGQDKKGNPIKIDGDWMLLNFSERDTPAYRGLELEPDCGIFLPLLNPATDPKVYNWGDQYQGGVIDYMPAKYFRHELSDNPDVVQGVTEGLKEICEWSNDDIKEFIKEFGLDADLSRDLFKSLVERRDQLQLVYGNYLKRDEIKAQALNNAHEIVAVEWLVDSQDVQLGSSISFSPPPLPLPPSQPPSSNEPPPMFPSSESSHKSSSLTDSSSSLIIDLLNKNEGPKPPPLPPSVPDSSSRSSTPPPPPSDESSGSSLVINIGKEDNSSNKEKEKSKQADQSDSQANEASNEEQAKRKSRP